MESQTTEYKLQWADKYLAYVSGFANSQGGTLYIGINDAGEVVGIDNTRYLLENLPNKIIQATGIIPDIEMLNSDGKEYIAIHIKSADQPVSCNGKYYMRSGSTLQELNGNSLTEFLLKQNHTTWDNHIVSEATFDDIDIEAVGYFVDLAVDAKRLDKSVKYENTEHILRKLKLINKQGKLTFAALMLFGKDIEDYCLSASFRIGRFGASQADLIFDDYIACPLIRMPEKVMQTLRSRYLVAPVRYEGLQRIEPLEIPEDALREIICNAIVHRDYRDTFTQMRVYDDHIELWNSGVFPPEITVDNLMSPHESHPRNELIAKVFYLAGFIENWGRGYEKIKESFTKENLQVPSFEQIRGGILATIRREKFIALNKQNVGENVGDVSVIELTERQRKIVNLIINDPTISATRMSVMMSVIKRTVERELAALRKQGVIAREGNARTGHWRIIDKNNE
ncbi:MAG: putative DNA binding domain-containing protein [Salinivirgaceae bacterium]|nr:putative DNA binding domain-containing protein [Salinivirgaceae bacterium]